MLRPLRRNILRREVPTVRSDLPSRVSFTLVDYSANIPLHGMREKFPYSGQLSCSTSLEVLYGTFVDFGCLLCMCLLILFNLT